MASRRRPTTKGTWRSLDASGKLAYLQRVRDRHFSLPLRERERLGVGTAGAVHVLDGADFDDGIGFLCAIGEAVNGPGGYFGVSLLAFDDCLFGGFGLQGPCTVRWLNAERSRRLLDVAALIEHYASGIEPSLEEFGELEADEESPSARFGVVSLFDEVVDMIRSVRTRHPSGPDCEITLELLP